MIDVIAIYDDAIDRLFSEIASTVSIERASHVEPVTVDGKVQWYADMKPIKGPKLGPFIGREDALHAEHAWLMENVLTSRKNPE